MRILTKKQPYVKPSLVIQLEGHTLKLSEGVISESFDVGEYYTQDGRSFHLSNPHDAELHVDCFIHESDPAHDFCTCADSLVMECRHMKAMRYLVEENIIPHPFAGMPESAPYTPAELAEMAGEELPF